MRPAQPPRAPLSSLDDSWTRGARPSILPALGEKMRKGGCENASRLTTRGVRGPGARESAKLEPPRAPSALTGMKACEIERGRGSGDPMFDGQ